MSSFKCALVETFWTLGLKKELTANTNSVTVIIRTSPCSWVKIRKRTEVGFNKCSKALLPVLVYPGITSTSFGLECWDESATADNGETLEESGVPSSHSDK